MSAEEPETEAGAANDTTEVVDDDRLREAAGGQAWSDADDDADDGPESHPWSVVTGHAAALISVGVAVAAITVMVGWLVFQKDRPGPSPAAEKSTSSVAAPAPPPAGAPTSVAAPSPAPPPAAPPRAVPVAVVGAHCRPDSTPTVDADGATVYCAIFPDMPMTALWSRTPGPLSWPTIGGERVPDQAGSYPWVVVCEQQTGRTYNYCENAIAQSTYEGDGPIPES